jgi:hypothetical protein
MMSYAGIRSGWTNEPEPTPSARLIRRRREAYIGVHEMAIENIATLEAKIRASNGLNAQQRAELLALLAELNREIVELSKTHQEHATSIASFTDLTAQEAMRQHRNQHLLRIAIEGLSTSVEEFEASHPELVNTVNKVSAILSNMGI